MTILSDYKKEIALYFATRFLVFFIVVFFLNSGIFFDDIKFMMASGSHPFQIITGDVLQNNPMENAAYSPLEPFLYAPFVFLIQTVNGVRMTTFVFEMLTFFLLLVVANKMTNLKDSKKIVMIYILLPITWIESILWAENEIISSFFLMLCVYFIVKDNEKFSSLTIGLAAIFSKIINVIMILPLVIKAKDKKMTLFLAVIPILIIYLPLVFNNKTTGTSSSFGFWINFGGDIGAITFQGLARLIFGQNRYISNFLFALMVLFYLAYCAYLYFKTEKINFLNAIIIVYLIYFLFGSNAIHPEYYLIIIPVILLKLGVENILSLKEIAIITLYSVSLILTKIFYLLNFVSTSSSTSYSFLSNVLNFHNQIIGNQFLVYEELFFLILSLGIGVRYIVFCLHTPASAEELQRVKDLNLIA
jgi:hypothetical protein